MKQDLVRKWLVAGVLVALQGFSAPAQDAQTSTPSPLESAIPQSPNGASDKPATAQTGQGQNSEPRAKTPTQNPASIDEILKMVQAGVSKEVMKSYIETTPIAPHLSAADIVTLKEHGVPDELTVALMKRGAELAAQAKPAGASSEAPARVSGTISLNGLAAVLRSSQLNPGQLDPEGYDYFRYYYLYPRTLASANERILSSYPAFPAYRPCSPGYASPWNLRSRSFAPQFQGPWLQ
jgi:hypothetical protein